MLMLVLLHVLIALTSLIYTTWLNFKPAQKGIRAAYWLVAATLGSGTYLVISTGSNMLQSCMTGLVYLGFVTAGLASANYRLNKQNSQG
jgi:hypothetical protein